MSHPVKKQITNKDLTILLRSIAAAYLIRNANRFRIIAYEKAADAVEKSTREMHDIWQEGKLEEVPGIGSIIAGCLDEYFRTGRVKHFDTILKKIPAAVFELMKVPGIGPKKAFKLASKFNIRKTHSTEDLKNLALRGKIAKLPQFGDKSQESILESLSAYERNKDLPERILLPNANRVARDVVEYLNKSGWVKRIDVLGSLRRMVQTIGDVDIAIVVDKGHEDDLIQYFTKYPKTISVYNAGGKKASILVFPYVRVDIRVQEEKSYGSMLQYFTGSKIHNIQLREYAIKKGYSLSEYGIRRSGDKKTKRLTFKDEEDFYHFLGLQYIPPEMREGTNEINLAIKRQLPRLVEPKDIKGDLHTHSNYDLKTSHDSGENSYREICKKAKELGYSFVGLSDHNPKKGGLSEKQVVDILRKRKEYIQKTLEEYRNKNFTYFVGLETDILPDGSIAVPDEAVEYLDYIIVSIHSVFNMKIRNMTNRVKKALLFPKVRIFGHPTARLINKREGIDLDWDEIFDICRKKNIALEINSWPERLDLPDTLVRYAVQNGVRCAVNTDAHANSQMDNLEYGVSVARRGWATKHDIINTLPLAEFKKWLTNYY